MPPSAVDALRFDDPAFVADPYPTYANVLREGPVQWHPMSETWLVLGHAASRSVLDDHARFAADWRRAGYDVPAPVRSVQTTDPPDHHLLRRVLTPLVSRASAARVAAASEHWWDQHGRRVDTALLDGDLDLMRDVCLPVAVRTTLEVLGLDAERDPGITDATRTIVEGMTSGLGEGQARSSADARSYLNERLAAWFTKAGDGTELATVRDAGERAGVDPELLASSLRVVYLAGVNSTSRFLGGAFAALLGIEVDRVSWSTRSEVHELLRFAPPVQLQQRVSVHDTTLAECDVGAGEVLTIVIAAANRDPAVFDDPHRLDPHRPSVRHLGLGHGVHTCLGAPLLHSQVERSLAWFTEHRATSGLSAAGPVLWEPNAALRGPTSLPVGIAPG